ncbi:MAG TPA: hypothetical protein DIW30_08375 [Bacteroidales bacterium]|nr:hypothetical protein [Bacteroidales bacterium]
MYLFLISLPVLMSGCLDKSESHYTPRIGNSVFIRNHQDTLLLHINEASQQIMLDTIERGDTVNFVVAYTSVGNNLLSGEVAWDKAFLDLEIKLYDDLRSTMLATSDTLNGVINLPVGYYYMSLPIEFRALQTGSPTLTFTAVTDSKFSPATRNIVVPIR